MKTKTNHLAALCGIVGILLFSACSKNNSGSSSIPPGQSKISLYLSDAPTNFYKVLVNITQVAVLIDTANQQNAADDPDQWKPEFCGHGRGHDNKSVIWDTLNIIPGTYDLLKLRNGVDTLLGTNTYPSGKIIAVKITLGTNNTVYTDSVTSYPLQIFGFNTPTSILINVSRENVYSVSNNEFQLWLDFNLQRSLFLWGSTYYLKPYVVAYNYIKLAKIKGLVLPHGASTLVKAYNSTDSLYAIPEWDGDYQISGVKAGTYNLTFLGQNGYKDTTLTGIVVDSSKVTTVPTITLHQ
jgi:hypothetical protein